MSDAVIQGNGRTVTVPVDGAIDTPEEAFLALGAVTQLMEEGDSFSDYSISVDGRAYSYAELAPLLRYESEGESIYWSSGSYNNGLQLLGGDIVSNTGLPDIDPSAAVLLDVNGAAAINILLVGDNPIWLQGYAEGAGRNYLPITDYIYDLRSGRSNEPERVAVIATLVGTARYLYLGEIVVEPEATDAEMASR